MTTSDRGYRCSKLRSDATDWAGWERYQGGGPCQADGDSSGRGGWQGTEARRRGVQVGGRETSQVEPVRVLAVLCQRSAVLTRQSADGCTDSVSEGRERERESACLVLLTAVTGVSRCRPFIDSR